MKKYLITAAMAVAVSGALVSCHDDEITGSAIEQKIQAFEDVFAQAFGKPDPNHTWGFGKPIEVEGVVTRGEIDANGNMWKDAPGVGPKERDSVYNYVKDLTVKNRSIPSDLITYYVTHIYTGTDKHGSSNYENSQMNQLEFAKTLPASITWDGQQQGQWFHIYDFNAAVSTDFEGNMLVVNTPPLNFAYYNSADSKWHDRWIGVDGADINDAYSDYYYICFDFEAMPNEIYTVFEMPNSNNAKVNVPGRWPNATGQTLIDAGITSLFTTGEQGEKVYTVEANWKAGQVFNEHYYAPGNDVYTDWIIRLTKAQSMDVPVVKVKTPGTTVTDGWTKKTIISGEKVLKSGRVFCEDIVSSQSKYRFEDLDYNDVVFDAATIHNYKRLETTYYDKDKNFDTSISPNPVVTYEFTEGNDVGCNEYYTIIRVLAGGGTLPIEIKVGEPGAYQFNSDLHELFDGTSSSIMINTLANTETDRQRVNMAKVASGLAAVDLEKNNTTETGDAKKKFFGITDIDKKIELNVNYLNVATTIKSKYYANDSRGASELVASAKIMVPLGTRWPKERTNISTAYPKFNDWVKTEKNKISGDVATPFWDYPAADENFYIDSRVVGLDPEVYAEGNFLVDEKVTEYPMVAETSTTGEGSIGEERATNRYIATPTGTIIYNYNNTNDGPGYLYDGSSITTTSTTITAGSKIRVYGVSIAGWEVTCNNQKKSASNDDDYTSNGYVEFYVTGNITNPLNITGKNFTVTYVTVIGSTPAPQTIWENTSTNPNPVNWTSDYRFALDGHDGNKECIATFSSDVWNRIMNNTFYLVVRGTNPSIRVTNGHWTVAWPEAEYNFEPGNSRLTNNGDGTWTLKIDLANSALVGTILEKHLLFTGTGYTPVRLYFQ